MSIFGVSCLFHDASISVVDNDQILFAGHSERYSRQKNDKYLNQQIVNEAIAYGGEPELVVYYEKPWKKLTRFLYTGEYKYAEWNPKQHLKKYFPNTPIKTVSHHESHAAAGYFTSPFDDAAIVVADAIGEWDTISVWQGTGDKLEKLHSTKYPHSIGLLYSAFTERCGLKPNEEEYIMMGMCAYGTPNYVNEIKRDFVDGNYPTEWRLKENVHIGIGNWMPNANINDLAASIQYILEEYLQAFFIQVKQMTNCENLVYMGGVALNCLANGKLLKSGVFKRQWIMPNPGDAGSSLGAILAHNRDFVEWKGPYLGTNIDSQLMTTDVVDCLLNGEIVGIANGRAEFGPRAFGNRSLICDPRTLTMKRRVNTIKKRQQFRPFAPMIMEEYAHQYFDMPMNASPYMQYAVKCKTTDIIPAVCHADNTSRVQTVNREQNPVLYNLLNRWYSKTGCPVLLNTSLNIKGMPLVNTWSDALEFSQKYNVKVF